MKGRGGAPGPAILAALALLELAWFGWFASEPLPEIGNAGGKGLARVNLLIRAVPHFIPGLGLRDSYLGQTLEKLGHVGNLVDRVPIVLAAGFIATSALALGGLILRALKLRGEPGPAERVALAYGLGATGLGLGTLLVGRLGGLDPRLIRTALALPIVVEGALIAAAWRREVAGPRPRLGWPAAGFLAVVGPFLAIMALGSMLPAVDFDALEYHLQGPKEYYQGGRIAFLPHNVYTSMPSGVEMLHLLGMEVLGDWWTGALVGQLLVALYAPATAALVVASALRVGSGRAAWVAGVVYLTTPWVYRVAVLPYVEGPLCYFHAALIWVAIRASEAPAARFATLAGLLAGGAFATKYPALVSAVVPASACVLWFAWRDRSGKVAAGFALGLGLVAAPWLARNLADTGNPVYPLGYRVFGGRHWDSAREARWNAAHGPKPVEARALARNLVDVAGRSDWQSPLYAALVPLALARPGSRRVVGGLLGFSAYLFLTWWLLTHRLDRFWLPILPGLAILAGLGADWSGSRGWSGLLGAVLASGVTMNAVYCSTPLAALNEWTGDLKGLREEIPRLLNPSLAKLGAELRRESRVLLVGPAAVFHLARPIVYNTVFDEDWLENLASGRTPAEVLAGFRKLGLTHVYVDWSEIERYRSPGNYGFSPFVTPGALAGLVASGVLRGPSRVGPRQELYEVGEGR